MYTTHTCTFNYKTPNWKKNEWFQRSGHNNFKVPILLSASALPYSTRGMVIRQEVKKVNIPCIPREEESLGPAYYVCLPT